MSKIPGQGFVLEDEEVFQGEYTPRSEVDKALFFSYRDGGSMCIACEQVSKR